MRRLAGLSLCHSLSRRSMSPISSSSRITQAHCSRRVSMTRRRSALASKSSRNEICCSHGDPPHPRITTIESEIGRKGNPKRESYSESFGITPGHFRCRRLARVHHIPPPANVSGWEASIPFIGDVNRLGVDEVFGMDS